LRVSNMFVLVISIFFFFQAEDGIRDRNVTGVQTCALPISIERELAPVFVRVDGYTGGDTVVLAEPGDNEVLGAHTLESLGLTAEDRKSVVVPTVGLALLADAASSIPMREIEFTRGQGT